MTLFNHLLLLIHFVGFVAGGANSVIGPILGAKMQSPDAAVRDMAFEIAEKLAKVGKWALTVLFASGLLMLWLKWGWHAPNHWFWVKMGALAVMVVLIGINHGNLKRLKAGDTTVLKSVWLLGNLTGLAFLVVLGAAICAFE